MLNESTTIKFTLFPNDDYFQSISFTKYINGNLLFMISNMTNHRNGIRTGSGKALELNETNKDEFESFVKNLYKLVIEEK